MGNLRSFEIKAELVKIIEWLGGSVCHYECVGRILALVVLRVAAVASSEHLEHKTRCLLGPSRLHRCLVSAATRSACDGAQKPSQAAGGACTCMQVLVRLLGLVF